MDEINVVFIANQLTPTFCIQQFGPIRIIGCKVAVSEYLFISIKITK